MDSPIRPEPYPYPHKDEPAPDLGEFLGSLAFLAGIAFFLITFLSLVFG